MLSRVAFKSFVHNHNFARHLPFNLETPNNCSKQVQRLGGKVVDKSPECDVLVTDKVGGSDNLCRSQCRCNRPEFIFIDLLLWLSLLRLLYGRCAEPSSFSRHLLSENPLFLPPGWPLVTSQSGFKVGK